MNDNEAALFALLRTRYRRPEWCLLSQVRNSTGFARITRTADAIAMNTYPSRGLAIHGFEFKVRRGDWLAELKNPDKAEDIALMCDYWWVVAEKQVVADGELPHGWGLLEPHGRGLRAKSMAACMCDEAMLRERLMDRPFVAAILRRVLETDSDEALIQAARTEGLEQGRAEGRERECLSESYRGRELADLQSSVATFSRASGVEINAWNGQVIGAAVRVVLALRKDGYGSVLGTLQRVQQDLRAQAERMAELAADLSAEVSL